MFGTPRILDLLVASIVTFVAATAAASPGAPRVPPIPKPTVPPALVGLEKLGSYAPDRGFLDDVVAADDHRLAVVVTDGADLLEVRVLDQGGAPQATIPLGAVTRAVRRLYLLGTGVLVVTEPADDGSVAGALLGWNGKLIKAHKPATDLFVRDIDGKPAVIAYRRNEGKSGTVHSVQAIDPAKGKPIAKRAGQLTLDGDGRDAKLDFRPAYFLDDQTVAVGRKGGVWKKSLDMRAPDSAARYDLLTRRWLSDQPITDVVAHQRAEEVMAEVGERAFVRTTPDLRGLELWRDGAVAVLTLDQPLDVYDIASLTTVRRGDQLWMSLRIDPVNPPAVARKKADPEYLDLFEIRGEQAVRRARVFAPKQKLRWGFAGDVLWVMEKNVGFERGSRAVGFYRFQ